MQGRGKEGTILSISCSAHSHNLAEPACRDLSEGAPTDLFMKARRAGEDFFRAKMQCLLHVAAQFQISKE